MSNENFSNEAESTRKYQSSLPSGWKRDVEYERGRGGLQNVYFLLPKTYYPGALEVHSGEGATEAQSGSAGEYVDGTAVCPKLSPVRSSGAFFQFLKVFPLDNNDMGTPEVVG